MQYFIFTDQVFAIALGLTPAECATIHVITKVVGIRSVVIGSETWYHVSRNLVIKEVPWVTEKPDTIYRAFKALDKKYVIRYRKMGDMDLVMPGKLYSYWGKIKDDNFFGFLSEHSDLFPNKHGFESELWPDLNPTYKETNLNKESSKKKKVDAALNGADSASTNIIPDEIKAMLHDAGDTNCLLWDRLSKKNRKYIQPILNVVSFYNENRGKGVASMPYTKGVYNKIIYWLKDYTVEDIKLAIEYRVDYYTNNFRKPENIKLGSFLRTSNFELIYEEALAWQKKKSVDPSKVEPSTEAFSKFVSYIRKGDSSLMSYLPLEEDYIKFVDDFGVAGKRTINRAVSAVTNNPDKYRGSDFVQIAERWIVVNAK